MKLAHVAIVFALTVPVTGCDSAVGSESPNQGHSYIVGVDISGSRTKTDLDESKKLLYGLIDRLEAGDHLTLIEVYQGGREPARQWSDSIRTPRDPKQLTGSDRRRVEDFKDIARMQTSILFDSLRTKQIHATDIFGTLARAADYAKASRNRATTLLLLSDMINETPDVRMTSRRLSYVLQQQVHLYTPEANDVREQIDRYVEAERQIEGEMARRKIRA